jgi:glycosyltransferase involved in cell wall biosynthesis
MPGQPRQQCEGKVQILRYLPNRISVRQRPWLLHALTYVLTQLWFVLRLSGLIHRHNIDLIHFHTRYRGRGFYRALQRSQVPIVADLRDKMTRPQHLLNVADRLLCCGEGVQRFALEGGFPQARTQLIPNAFTPPPIPSAEAVSEICQRYAIANIPYLLFVGDITYNKGVYDLLQAYERWHVEQLQTKLVLVGTNREGKSFLERVSRMENVMYLGRLAHRDVLALMRGAQIVVLPSRSEGLPTVILEALALGTKVLCPPHIPEFDHYLLQFTLPDVNADAILERLNVIWHTDALPDYPLAEHSIERVTAALCQVYNELIGKT